MAKFYKQPEGLLIPPEGFDKFHVAWTLDNVLAGFKEFYQRNNRWPTYLDFKNCLYLPTAKTIQRSFGGTRKIKEQLGLKIIDDRTGATRRVKMKEVWKRGVASEELLHKALVERFHEPFVHDQSKVVESRKYLRVDFLIYHKTGKFAIDIFFPEKEYERFSSNTAIKFRIYKAFPFTVYLCVANPEVTEEQVQQNIKKAKIARNKSVRLITLEALLLEINNYEPLTDPYGGAIS